MEDKKWTQEDYYNKAIEIINQSNDKYKDEVIYFLQTRIAAIKSKSDKAKERANVKKQEGDQLRQIVKSALTLKFQLIEEIHERVLRRVPEDFPEEVTLAKTRARLIQLVNIGEASKKERIMKNGKAKMTYRSA